MIIFVDGFQNTGKSTLIESCKYKHNRFPFNQYLDKLKLKDDINGYQMGKDLGMLFALQYTKENVVFDRGPFSTIFYSLKEKRFGPETEEIIFRFMKELSYYKCYRFIFVVKKNETTPQVREHNDGFDYLNDDEDPNKEKLLDLIMNVAKSLNIKIHIFENDYSLSLKQNIHKFNDLLGELVNEYNRD